ncbi:DUF3164 family protein [Phytopseudomonas daroniae]|uniref:DUF3164 family protein n=1 Tax=Phytopseudomonas daroniae TaxID=2487519 RepID=UPI0010383DDC|nr:DUF3164 family protein [Pseudomonas daroniae]TBU75229.1 sulfate transporter [Pseudomonas daroniae]
MTTTLQTAVPDGFREDAQGRLVHESMIKPLDWERDQLVMAIVGKTKELNQRLRDFKTDVFGDVDALVTLAAEEYGAKLGGAKGNVTLFSYDGRYKVLRAKADNIRFDERLQGAKALIDECLQEWVQGSRPEIITLINDAFRVDQAGNIRTGSVLALRRLEISDERWIRAMQAISDAVTVVATSSYVRVYERIGDTDQYQPISLDIAKV